MKSVVFDGTLQYQPEYPNRPLKEGQVCVDVLSAGICETDLQLCRGYMGFRGVLGHEFVGIPRSGKFAGRRVVCEINCSCHSCPTCLQGNSNHCPHRTVIGILNHDGAFAESVNVPERNLHVIPDSLSTEEAVFVEPVAAACRIPQQIPLSGGENVTILGDGRLGNLCAQVLRHHGCSVLVIGKHHFKMRMLEELGIRTCHLDKAPRDRTADIVVDCTGSPSGLTAAIGLVRPAGTIVLKTTVAAEESMHMAPIVIDEIRLIGSRCGPFEDAVQLLACGAVQVRSMISAHFRLEDAVKAFDHAVRKDALKVLFHVRESN